jgi:fatty-acid peroxygenase
MTAPAVPRDPAFDSSLALLREGYAFILSRCRRFGADLFEARLMLSKVVCMSGPEAAAEFYRPNRFTRADAMPASSFALIQDKGSVMELDGEAHRRRKEMFLSVMRPERLGRFAELVEARFRDRLRTWPRRDRVVLFDEANLAISSAVCEWAGLRLTDEEIVLRTAEFDSMIDGTGSIGPRNWRGHLLRARTETWARGLIRRVREGSLEAPEGSALRAIATFRDAEGRELDLASAAVELINALRPTVANARYVAFAAVALAQDPSIAEQIAADEEALESFVQEVRRFYPFIPFMGGRVVEPFGWRGREFQAGEWAILDLYGTNRDPRSWRDPETFRADRFIGWRGDPYAFVPSGGGAHEETHRCPGEWMTIACVKAIVRLLVSEVRYETPRQDLAIRLSRIPAIPQSRVVLTNAVLASS